MTGGSGRAIGLGVSAYVVGGVMIDTGFPRVCEELLDAVRALSVRGVMVTHWHEDHAGNVEALAAHGLPIIVHEETASILRNRPAIRLYRRVFWGQPPHLRSPITPFDANELQAIHTPGHSPDHRVVWDPRTHTLFSGDLWLGVRARVLHSTENPYRIIESLRIVLALEPERMFDAHRGVVLDPASAIRAKIDWLGATLADVEQRIAAGWGDRAIVDRVLGGEELAALLSRGDYSRRNLVRAVRRKLAAR
jgi:glyoxylase-like metal-dependent hydrolase (beta-lactamase superfamily II)